MHADIFLFSKFQFYYYFYVKEVLVELKAVKQLTEIHEAQLINYLKATNKKVGLLINFGTPRIQIKRLVNRL